VVLQAEAIATNALTYLPLVAIRGLAALAGVASVRQALEQLEREPLFCMETGATWQQQRCNAHVACTSGAPVFASPFFSRSTRLPATSLVTAVYMSPRTALRLFYWVWLAYVPEGEMDSHPAVNRQGALRLLGLQNLEVGPLLRVTSMFN
jgi:hypothetical protein